jgi:histidinol-phosphatase (PHP family)
MSLPADNHVHSEWSWDTATGDMLATCAEAVRLGVPSVAFTEHVDHTVWQVGSGDGLPAAWTRHGIADGALAPPDFDAEGYLASVERCRTAFPDLRIVTGVELGEPHWHREAVDGLLGGGAFTRVLASLHSTPVADGLIDVGQHYRHAPAEQVYSDYLTGVEELVAGYDGFQVLAHIDYPLRRWPAGVPLEIGAFEDQLRHVLGLLRDAGKVLEVNTRVPLPAAILRWWHEAGGEAISFGSDAHRPDLVARGFADAVVLAEATGFRPGRDPLDFWTRA